MEKTVVDGIDNLKLNTLEAPGGFKKSLMTPRMRRNILFQDIDLLIDGGANIGQYALWARQCGFQGKIVSFEPASQTFRLLSEAALSDDNWECYNVAIGPNDGEVVLNLSPATFGTSILRPNENHFRAWPNDTGFKREPAQMRSLSSLWRELGCEGQRIYLKLDVEGAELSALEGAGRLLERFELIELELSLVSMYHGAPTFEDVVTFLTSRGFSAVALESNHDTDETTGQMLMVDGIFRSPARSYPISDD